MASEISTAQLHERLQGSQGPFFLVDTMPAESYAFRHLPGAIGLPLEELPGRARRVLDPEAEVVVYCSGPR